jgi:hypothetical protein
MTTPKPPAPTPEEALRAKLLDGIDDCLLSDGPPELAVEVEKLWQHILAALRAAAQAERERCVAWVKHESEIAESLNDYVGALRLAKAADRLESEWHLSPAPEGR